MAEKPILSIVAKPAAVPILNPAQLTDLVAALSDRYPHYDIQPGKDIGFLPVAVPGGTIMVSAAKVNKCRNTAELRAYINSLPVQG